MSPQDPGIDRTLALARHWLDVGRAERCLDVLDGDAVPAVLADVFLLRAEALLRLDRDEEAAAQARRGLALDAEQPDLLALLGMACHRLGALPEGERAFLAALRYDPQDSWLLGHYALLLTTAGEIEKAQRVADEGARLDPDQPTVRHALALLAHVRGRDGRAMALARSALEADPEDVTSHALLGAFAARRGQVARSAKHWRTAASLEPTTEIADEAREAGRLGSAALAPFRPLLRLGAAGSWLVAMVVMTGLALLGQATAAAAVAGLYAVLAISSWVVLPSLRRRARARR